MTVPAPKPRKLYDVDSAPTALLGRLTRRLRYRVDARLEQYGVTGVQWNLLARLANEDGLSQTTLQHRMGIEGATLTNIVQRLQRDGLIVRTADSEDRRRQRVWLTDKSRLLLPQIARQIERHRREVQRGLTEADLATLAALLRRIEENLE
jgi:MarR family transcriptional regulator for hemolysin